MVVISRFDRPVSFQVTSISFSISLGCKRQDYLLSVMGKKVYLGESRED
jgi:hypothetical protein